MYVSVGYSLDDCARFYKKNTGILETDWSQCLLHIGGSGEVMYVAPVKTAEVNVQL
jgi:hypothetical protein